MRVIEITSATNEKLKIIRSLAESSKRKEQAGDFLFLLEGQKLIQEALDKKVELIDVVASKSYYQDMFNKTELANKINSIVVVEDKLFKGLYTTDTSCGIVATAHQKQSDLDGIIKTKKTLLLADNIQDPGNLGTIIRTAYAFEAGGIILSKGSVDCYNPKVVRSTMGAIFDLPVVQKVELKWAINELKKNGYKIIALDSKAEQNAWRKPIDQPVAYILGNEGHGISADILSIVDNVVCIPINPHCESLNVAVTAGIILAQSKLK